MSDPSADPTTAGDVPAFGISTTSDLPTAGTVAARDRRADPERLLDAQPTQRRGRFWRRRSRRSSDGAALIAAVTQPIEGARTIAVLSPRGGVGKTTTAVMLGHTIASLRRDRVLAVDANPDAGSLGHRVAATEERRLDTLIDGLRQVHDYVDLRRYVTTCPSRLEVLATNEDPRLTRRIGPADAGDVLELLREHYPLLIADCGTGLRTSLSQAVLAGADQLVLVTTPRVDAVRSLDHLLGWLEQQRLSALARRAVVVINAVHPEDRLDPAEVAGHLRGAVAATQVVAWDDDLATGGTTSLEYIAPSTRNAYLELAATVVAQLV